MTDNELHVVARLIAKCGLTEVKMERKSDREYDISLKGKYAPDAPYLAGTAFSAWLPLLAIRELTAWTSESIASLTDYPDMVMEGDWSGVRDSSTETIWFIFDRFAA
jgi:hypothetical protein